MNKYLVVIAGMVVAILIFDGAVGGDHYFINKDHVHEDYSYLPASYNMRAVVAATSSGDRILL